MRKTLLIVGMLAVLICSIIIPVSAAAADDENSDYMITPWTDFSGTTRASPIIGTVTNDQTMIYYYTVNPGSSELDIAVTWILWPFNSELTMEIIRPNGQSIGVYSDSYDGSTDGNIPVRVTSSSLDSGQWTVKIKGKAVTGLQPFTLTINET